MPRRALPLAAVAIVQLAVLLATTLPTPERLTPAQRRAERADVGGPFPLELRSPTIVAGTSARVLVSLNRPSLGELMAKRRQSPTRQRAYVRSLTREERALISALEAKGVRFGDPVLYQRVYAGFAATVATDRIPQVQTLGLRVEPVARFYPAQVGANDAPAVRPLPTKATGRGPVAILDAFPRARRKPPRIFADEVGPSGGRGKLDERAGLRLAGVVQGELPRTAIMAVRTAGRQPLETGKFDVFATTDQLISAFERVVDPDRDGDSSDAVPVALTGLSAPYSGFSGSPAARAVDAASELGTLVVVAAGDGGESDGPYGTIGDPGAAGSALTVGGLDGSGDVAPASSRGPTYALTPKPDLAIGAGARTQFGAGWGTAVAAARVAGVAAALRAERPSLAPADAAAALVATAAPRGPVLEAGGGDPLLQAARLWKPTGSSAQSILRARLGKRKAPPLPRIGALDIVRRKGKADGVRFVAGAIKRSDKGQSVFPVSNLVLVLDGPSKRELTPPGGARDLLPGEYAYTLTPEIKSELAPGKYRFVLRARRAAGGGAVVRRSRPFKIA